MASPATSRIELAMPGAEDVPAGTIRAPCEDLVSDTRSLTPRTIPEAPDEWRRFYAEHWAWVYRAVRRFGGPGIAVEDAAQDVFLIAADRLHDFEGRAEIRTWLYRVCLNVGSEHRRKRLRQERLQRAMGAIAFWRGPITPLEKLETCDALGLAQQLLDQLSEKRRQVLLLCEIEGLSSEEAAQILGVPAGTIRTRLYAARRELADRLAEREAR